MTPGHLLSIVIQLSRKSAVVEVREILAGVRECEPEFEADQLDAMVRRMVRAGTLDEGAREKGSGSARSTVCLTPHTAAMHGLRLNEESTRFLAKGEREIRERREADPDEILECDFLASAYRGSGGEGDESDVFNPIDNMADGSSPIDLEATEEFQRLASIYLHGSKQERKEIKPRCKLGRAPKPIMYLQGGSWPLHGQRRGPQAPNHLPAYYYIWPGDKAEAKRRGRKAKAETPPDGYVAEVCPCCHNLPLETHVYCDVCDRWGFDYLFFGETIPVAREPEEVEAGIEREKAEIKAKIERIESERAGHLSSASIESADCRGLSIRV